MLHKFFFFLFETFPNLILWLEGLEILYYYKCIAINNSIYSVIFERLAYLKSFQHKLEKCKCVNCGKIAASKKLEYDPSFYIQCKSEYKNYLIK